MIRRFYAALALLVLVSSPLFAQGTALNQTTLSAAMTDTSGTTAVVASATGATASTTVAYIDNELMTINTVSGTTLTVGRGRGGTKSVTHLSGATVFIGPPTAFISVDPAGSCVPTNFANLPVINTRTGFSWNCNPVSSSGTTGVIIYAWGGWNTLGQETNANRTLIVPGTTYTAKLTDYVISVTTTGTFSGNSTSAAVTTIVLPTVTAGLIGKRYVIKDESGAITSTTYIGLSGTVEGVANAVIATLKTGYQSMGLVAGSNGWYITSCWHCGL